MLITEVEAAMEEECLDEGDRRVDGGVDMISELPDEILFMILSFLHYKEGTATSVLSSRWLDLWKHNPYLKFDRISQLPNQILAVILSFLSLKEAVATSALSSRWPDAWKHTPNLDFDRFIIPNFSDHHGPFMLPNEIAAKFIKIVNSVIQSHKALSLKNFRLSHPIEKCVVTKWLEFVFSRQVESLDLALDHLVLEELLRESRIRLQPQTDLIFFQSLKRLSLCGLKVSGDDIKLFLRNCPLLIRFAFLTSDVEVCGETLVLDHLDMFSCQGGTSIKVSAPNLTYMRFVGDLRCVRLLLENAPKLVEATIVTSDEDNSEQLFACSTSCYFPQLQILFLTHNSTIFLENCFTQVPNLKKLSVCYRTFDHSLLPVVTSMIWGYPLLEEFRLALSDCREECVQVAMDVGRSLHEHLQVFELEIYSLQIVTEDIARLVMYISNNCVALRKIIVHRRVPGENDQADRDYLAQRLQGNVPNHVELELFD